MPESEVTDAPDDAMDRSRPRARRRLPIGPLGLLLVTAVALAAAGVVVWLGTRHDDGAVDVTKALDHLATSTLVPSDVERVAVGDRAPDVRLEMLDGSTTSMSELRGKPVVLNFWSSTCAPCLKEMPDLEKVAKDHATRLGVVGVNVTDTAAAGREMAARTGVTYPNARDPQAEIFAAFGGTALPRTVLVDPSGKVVAVHNGALSASGFTDMLREHGLLD